MDDFLGEFIDEATGASNKKWALLIVATLGGAIGAYYLMLRLARRRREATVVSEKAATPGI